MAISTAAQPAPNVAPQVKVPQVEKDTGVWTMVGKQFAQQLYNQYVGTNRSIPCNCTNVGNVYTLTMLGVQPVYTAYASYDQFGFVASASSTGSVTALVVTAAGALATLKVFKTNGSAQAGNTDITVDRQYFLTYTDTLDSGTGGFVLR